MQPENQSGASVPPAPQAPQPTPQQPQPVQPVAPTQMPQQPIPQAPPIAPQSPPVQPMQPAGAYRAPQPTPQQPAPPAQPQPVAAQPQPALAQPTADALGGVALADQIEGGYGYRDEESEYAEEAPIDLSEPVTWQAKEYIHQEKGATWFVVFAIILVVFMAISIFLMKSWSFSILLVVIAIVIVVLAKRPPRVMEYALTEEGLQIDETLHKYSDFKSFGVIRDGEEFSIMLIPRSRFMPGITVYFPEEAGEDIVDVLGSRMPMRDLHLDVIDRIVRKLRL